MKGIDMRPLFAALIVLLLLAGCAGPAPAATAVQPTMPPAEAEGQPSPTAESTETSFHSDRYGYTVTFSREDWVVTETEGKWGPGEWVGTWYPGSDTYSAQDSSDVIIIAAQPVTGDVTSDQWADSLLKLAYDFDSSCTPAEAMQATTVGGEAAVVNSMTCLKTFNIFFVSTIHNGMGYWVKTRTSTGDRSDDWPNLEKLLSTWTFTD